MKFRCGTCGACYLIEGTEKLRKKRSLKCVECGNRFVLQPDQTFYSSSRNSQRICDCCGQFVAEADTICSCGGKAADKDLREELRIDNKEYYFFVVRKGRIQPTGKKVNWFGRGLLLAGVIALTAGLIIILHMPGEKRAALKNAILKPLHLPSRTETKVVILHSGQVYYAETIEQQGAEVKITAKDGRVVLVRKKDIQQVSTAVIDD
ncbi:hypothetical protein GCAAIG_00395 [Candidatus Electronema halotolerans]|jgi:DNA-directed RNA polymerase subunit RPC12/RpoP